MNTLSYGKRKVVYTVQRRSRATLEISVYPDSQVEVIAPLSASDDEIERRVQRRLRWITSQQRTFENFYPKPSPREYVSGESWLYQGRQYRLKVFQSDGKPKVALRRPILAVEVDNPKDTNEVRQLLVRWYRRRAVERLTARYCECAKHAATFGIEIPELRIQSMSKRWGSHSPSGRILLNPELVKAPTECIDYVILHELCHVRHPGHTRQFYHFLARLAPEWQRLKSRLEHLLI